MVEIEEEVASEKDQAACGFVLELMRSACLLSRVSDELCDRQNGSIDSRDAGEVVVLRQMIEMALPHLREAGADTCRQAALLIEQVRSEIVLGFQLSSQADDYRS